MALAVCRRKLVLYPGRILEDTHRAKSPQHPCPVAHRTIPMSATLRLTTPVASLSNIAKRCLHICPCSPVGQEQYADRFVCHRRMKPPPWFRSRTLYLKKLFLPYPLIQRVRIVLQLKAYRRLGVDADLPPTRPVRPNFWPYPAWDEFNCRQGRKSVLADIRCR